jgi:uncharacterized protein with HEPN domain
VTRSAAPLYLRILRALNRIDTYFPETAEEFLSNPMLQDAILMQLHEIGENLSQLRRLNEASFRLAPESWHQLIGLRNIISHGYEAVSAERIWAYMAEELGEFRQTIESAIDDNRR